MKTLVITPTYNEKDNIEKFIQAVLTCSSTDILIVDDNSPDKTSEIVKNMMLKSKRVHLLFRQNKEGLGKAYMAGFNWAIKHEYDFVVSMDADFSHRPEDLVKLLAASSKYDIVIGSRYIPGGKIIGWDLKRQLNSRLANMAARLMLGLKNKDITAGFKRYSLDFLKSIDFKQFISQGYSFQVEMVYWGKQHGFSLTEVPITFIDRTAGESKISGELVKSAKVVWRLAMKRNGFRQMVKFLIIGFGGALIDWIIFYILKIPLIQYGQTGKQLAKLASFTFSATFNYIFNRHWTFRSKDKEIAKQAGRFYVVAVFGLVLNNLIFYFITSPKFLHWRDVFGLIIATALVSLWNFFIHRSFTFKTKK